jgi:AcrR family transcriptional regulator
MASSVRELTPTPRAQEIVAVARQLLEEEGHEKLTMRRLADRLGMRAPSLYKHLPDKQALETALISIGFEEWTVAFERAAASEDPLTALVAVYRTFAREHPHLYRLMTERRLDRGRLPPGLEERAAAPFVAAVGGDRDAARALWAFAHGMTILELNERFPETADLDAAWMRGAQALTRP